MRLSKQQIVIIAAGVLLVAVIFGAIFFNVRSQSGPGSPIFTLRIWGIDSKDAVEGALNGYKAGHPLATLNYTQIDPKNYYAALIDALASGQGPDVFYVGNRALPKYKNKIVPLNPALFPNMTVSNFRDLYPMAAEQDLILGGQIYALPLYLDTMALIYNRDFFDQAGIVAPPKTWDEFQADVAALRQVNQNGQIVRAAAAIGGTEKTVEAGTDLLEFLMLQNGAKMVSDNLSSASFASGESGSNPGIAAFNFYLQFANSTSRYYTWNEGQPNSVDSFAAGKTAMIFAYQSALAGIKNKSPFLNFAVAPMPQLSVSDAVVNYPRYHGLVVSKQSQNQNWGWDFVIYLATNTDSMTMYSGGHPPALRSLIAKKMSDLDLGLFARQALTARSWYQVDDAQVDSILNGAIQSVLSGAANSNTALAQAQGQISQLMQADRQQ